MFLIIFFAPLRGLNLNFFMCSSRESIFHPSLFAWRSFASSWMKKVYRYPLVEPFFISVCAKFWPFILEHVRMLQTSSFIICFYLMFTHSAFPHILTYPHRKGFHSTLLVKFNSPLHLSSPEDKKRGGLDRRGEEIF